MHTRLIMSSIRFRFFVLLIYFCLFFSISVSFASPSVSLSGAAKQFLIESLKNHNDQSHMPGDGKTEGWLMVSEPGTTPVIFYAPLSINTMKPGFVSVTTLINYISDEANPESLLGVTLYNCASATKQEQSTVQYSMHWADGDVKLRIGLEEPWELVKVGTEGMRLMKTVCDLR